MSGNGRNRACGRYDACKHCVNLSDGVCICEDSLLCKACPMPRRIMLKDMMVVEESKEESE